MRDKRHDILFQPVEIGPVTAKNRFYQVPHCTGMGWNQPKKLAAMRGVKAEGGWGVVCTEYCSIHPTSDDEAYNFATLWDKEDVAAQHAMTSKVHEHGALAGAELWIGGSFVANLGTRLPPLGLQDRPLTTTGVLHPIQGRKMDKDDIRNIRKWHREAAVRAVEAEFDIVYVYATHGYLISQFLDPTTNERTDEYGGSLDNRLRIVRELIEETREAVAGKAAIATRFSVDLEDSESFDAFGMLAEMPDLWDLTVPDYVVEMGVSRFIKEGALVSSVAKAKELTSKPVAAVGRFTSPDTMAQVIRSGAQDMIGAARPSIADPFMPNKIDEGRTEDIRECIGCNVCYAHNSLGTAIRCTQNPTMGEEWRLGWHPERVPAAKESSKVLVVGAGPAGLEAARVLGERGHAVMLAEKDRKLGGRVNREALLPGLAEWGRVRDWRLGQIDKLDAVETFPESPMTAEDVLALDVDHVLVATGAKWASDAVGRHSDTGFSVADPGMILNAETVMGGSNIAAESVTIYDDDHYYMGSVLALALAKKGKAVTLVTPAGRVGHWGSYTEEQYASTAALIEAGVTLVTNRMVTGATNGEVVTACVFSGREERHRTDAVLPLTRRIPVVGLYEDLKAMPDGLEKSGIRSVTRIGDCEAPGIIAAAVHSGYRAAMELGETFDYTARYAAREHPAPRDQVT